MHIALAVAVLALVPSVAELKREYLDGLFRAKPHLASFMGDHSHDAELPDLSPAALTRRDAELAALQKRVAAVPPAALPLDDRIDLAILSDGIALELLYLRELRDWAWDPRLHDSFPAYDPREIVAGRLSDLLHGAFAPEAARRKSVAAQLTALPRFLAQKERAIVDGGDRPSKVHVEQAIKDNEGRIDFLATEVAAFARGDAATEAARAEAAKALAAHQRFLVDLRGKPGRDFRLGPALYRKKFPLALQTDLTPEELSARAGVVLRAAREELYAVAMRLARGLWPKERLVEARDGAARAALIRRVKDEISKDHPKAGELVAAHARNLDRLRAFITQKDLLALPPKETLRVEEMPAYKRGSAGAEYLAPGVLDTTTEWRATYYVDPVDPTWPAEKVESYLRGNNDYEVELTAAHEAYPGHHTQMYYERKQDNPLRAVLWNGPMAEGWAVYAEELLVRVGYGGARNDRYLLMALYGRMVSAMNAVLDAKLQGGSMTDEEALRMMMEEGFQERATAEKKLLRAKLDSTQLAQYFLGYSEITEAEKEERKRPTFRQRRFNESIVSHGSVAVRYLREYMKAAK